MRLDTDHLFGDLKPPMSGLVVAVSGGSDSLSLLIAAKTHADRHWPGINLTAVTVDHGLRPESADEARGVAKLCAARGIRHRTMVWRGNKPETGLSAAAREARYRLLGQAADEIGAACILTGHTMDDQAETVLMRSQRGAGAGLAGMARATLYNERVWIVRPLLDLRRAHLRAWLTSQGVRWFDDPSNESEAYERSRIRAQMVTDDVKALALAANAAGDERRALSDACAAILAKHVQMPTPGLFRIDRSFMNGERAVAIHALRVLLACVGGRAYLPNHQRVGELHDKIRAGDARVSLSRVVVDARKGAVWMHREWRGLPRHSAVYSFWDGRWRIEGGADADRLEIAAYPPSVEVLSDAPGAEVPAILWRAALVAEPAVYRDGKFLGLVGQVQRLGIDLLSRRIVAPYALFLPEFDLAVAQVLTHLMGNSIMQPAPWKKHNAP